MGFRKTRVLGTTKVVVVAFAVLAMRLPAYTGVASCLRLGLSAQHPPAVRLTQ